MAEQVIVRWQFDHLPTLLDGLDKAVVLAVDTVSARIERDAKAAAPVRTGALRASGFRLTPLYNDQSTNTARAMGLNPAMKPTGLLSGVGPMEFVIGFTANYAIYVHDGARGRAGRPFLMEPTQRHFPEVEGVLGQMIDSLADGSSIAGGPANVS